MADLRKILSQLSKQRSALRVELQQIERAIAVLGGGGGPIPLGAGKRRGRKAVKRRPRKPMSAAARKAVSQTMKKYWATRRKKKNG